jgi:hypothetical protein
MSRGLIITSTKADGSGAKEFEGFPVSDCGNYWGTTKELANQAMEDSAFDESMKEIKRLRMEARDHNALGRKPTRRERRKLERMRNGRK